MIPLLQIPSSHVHYWLDIARIGLGIVQGIEAVKTTTTARAKQRDCGISGKFSHKKQVLGNMMEAAEKLDLL